MSVRLNIFDVWIPSRSKTITDIDSSRVFTISSTSDSEVHGILGLSIHVDGEEEEEEEEGEGARRI